MKKHSRKKSVFSLIFFLISLIMIPFLFGIETFKVLVGCVCLIMIEMVAIGIIALIVYTIIEEIKAKNRKQEEES